MAGSDPHPQTEAFFGPMSQDEELFGGAKGDVQSRLFPFDSAVPPGLGEQQAGNKNYIEHASERGARTAAFQAIIMLRRVDRQSCSHVSLSQALA
ncbi:hypothetical protein [Sinorhizobium chiapasense]|uniref:Uncharacterized protein n=1 Tax=Sinorhizobium chiapasense TaxID=501572 RepID=A0ABZ2BJE4_9HYPH